MATLVERVTGHKTETKQATTKRSECLKGQMTNAAKTKKAKSN